ncbi:hypothetical protein HYPSUDRAFT_204413 [Hypholoma sublateritium FD-334 SS-4]|uniref:Uncharacterized protein n=1 Tax=Hypholoma sublateritium (strain FD-334 SS-4) TaxID=945553 RepID=A0A0D2PI13_HYPSF|nr:hypothetical protein HYPSUDRAFT_204413 [Hypholoma sublateritium FD-334 SS-4]
MLDFASPAAEAQWDHRVLWDLIDREPELYYDTDQFTLPAPLKTIIEVTDVLKIYTFVAYFRSLQANGKPFQFYKQSEVGSDPGSDDEDSDIFQLSRVSMSATAIAPKAPTIAVMPAVPVFAPPAPVAPAVPAIPIAPVVIPEAPVVHTAVAPGSTATAAYVTPIVTSGAPVVVPVAVAPAASTVASVKTKKPQGRPPKTPAGPIAPIIAAAAVVPGATNAAAPVPEAPVAVPAAVAPGAITAAIPTAPVIAPAVPVAALSGIGPANITVTGKSRKPRGRPSKISQSSEQANTSGGVKTLRPRNQKRAAEQPKLEIQPPKKKAKAEKGMKGWEWVPIVVEGNGLGEGSSTPALG